MCTLGYPFLFKFYLIFIYFILINYPIYINNYGINNLLIICIVYKLLYLKTELQFYLFI